MCFRIFGNKNKGRRKDPFSQLCASFIVRNMAAIVIGVSNVPGIGFAVAKKMAAEGLKVGIIGRQLGKLEAAKAAILKEVPSAVVSCETADATKKEQIEAAIDKLQSSNGPTTCLVYNASARPFPKVSLAEATVDRVEGDFTIVVLGALLASQAVLPEMRKMGRGTIIYTGATASLRGAENFGPFCIAKSALRTMAQSMAKELAPEGIHVAHVIIDGMVDMPAIRGFAGNDIEQDGLLDPDSIAESFFMLHSQNKRCFTFELDVRPCLAKW